MNRRFVSFCALAAVALFALTAPVFAALAVGAKAPDFTLQATQGGNVFTFSLADALKKGPVVVYFYPAAFTTGCTIEAHEFADAIDQYHALGATVIGVSHDQLATLQKFSVSECRSKFAVAADTQQTVEKAYDAVLSQHPEYANRTSYVIAPDGTIIYSYTNLDPSLHVQNTLAALKTWSAAHPKKWPPYVVMLSGAPQARSRSTGARTTCCVRASGRGAKAGCRERRASE